MTDLDLTITRVFEAPRELVFEVWTNPDHLAMWWGPTGFTTESCTVRLEDGGRWRTCIRNGADGSEHWASGVYHEVRRPERLVFSFAWEQPDGAPGHDTLVTVTFDERDGRTEMTFHQAVFENVQSRDGHHGGWQATFDDLTAYLDDLPTATPERTRTMNLPKIVDAAEWATARAELLDKEKVALRALDGVNAERRRLPMVRWDTSYVFHSAEGTASLLDLFDGRRQLITYHFMMFPGDPHRCPGCSLLVDNIGHQAHLHARDTTLVVTAPAPIEESEPYRERMGWTVPWYSSYGSTFTEDCGTGDGFGISVFLRDGDDVFRTYFTTGRGGDLLTGTLRYLDLTPLGRQEAWEEASEGTDAPSSWWRLHDEY